MDWIHQTADWPAFTWSSEVLVQKLADIRHCQGRLLEPYRISVFDLRTESNLNTLTVESENTVLRSASVIMEVQTVSVLL